MARNRIEEHLDRERENSFEMRPPKKSRKDKRRYRRPGSGGSSELRRWDAVYREGGQRTHCDELTDEGGGLSSRDFSRYATRMGMTPAPKNTVVTGENFATDGVLFKRAFMPAPVCFVCRSAIITGVYETTTGTHQYRSSREFGIVPKDLRLHFPEGIKTIPELMRDARYFTFHTGKDDSNFHYDRTKLSTVGSKENHLVGQNGWQGETDQHLGTLTKNTGKARPDQKQPWFGKRPVEEFYNLAAKLACQSELKRQSKSRIRSISLIALSYFQFWKFALAAASFFRPSQLC